MTKTAKILLGVMTVMVLSIAALAAIFILSTNNESENKEIVHANDGRLHKIEIENAIERGAVCNDGSPAVLFFDPAEEGYEDKWIVWFKGGGGCKNPEECALRWEEEKNLMSSLHRGDSVKKGGILSSEISDNPDFYTWNHVMLDYCSSDGWVGDTVYEDEEVTWHFNGKDIVEAAFEDLMNGDIFANTINDASEVIIAGTSAGGGGVSQNINDIAEALPDVRVTGIVDSSWKTKDVETDAFDEEFFEGLESEESEIFTGVVDFQNRQLDETCLSAEDDMYDCAGVEGVSSYWSVPVFIYIDQYDRNKLSSYFEQFAITDPGVRRNYAEDYAESVRNSIELLEAVYSPQDTFHGAVTNNHFTEKLIGNVSFATVFGNWYFERSGPVRLVE